MVVAMRVSPVLWNSIPAAPSPQACSARCNPGSRDSNDWQEPTRRVSCLAHGYKCVPVGQRNTKVKSREFQIRRLFCIFASLPVSHRTKSTQNSKLVRAGHREHTHMMSMRSALGCWTLLVSLLVLVSRQPIVEGFASSFVGSFAPQQVHRVDHLQQGTSSSSSQQRSMKMFFGGPSGSMPKLYDGWFKKTQQIQKDIVAGAKSAMRWDSGTRGGNMIPSVQQACYNMIDETTIEKKRFVRNVFRF